MTTWREFAEAAPDLAAAVRARFDAGRHKTLATVRADGSPRISGIECEITDDDLVFGSMGGARKAADLARDPRFAIHSPTSHPGEGREREWEGEAKIAGRAVPDAADPTEGPAGATVYRADISEVVFTHLDPEATVLVVEWWTPAGELRRVERA